ncbi:hypothetical protein QE152_g4071 [Popillia japonica]|uniref:Uncharacterized protein n=1 Tax=Popillia japonica TaxID=7064 RepID=A0AAW1MXH2_POPJA
MAPSKDSSIAFNCKKCTKEVKLYCLCSICNAYYHPSCVLKIPGMYIDEKGKLHCCEDITCEITKYYCVLDEIEKQKRQLEEKNTQIQKLRQELKKQEEACECKQKDIELSSQLKQRLFAANNKVLEMSMADYDKQLEQLNDGDDEYTQNIIDNEYEDKLKRLEQRMQQMEKSLDNEITKTLVNRENIGNQRDTGAVNTKIGEDIALTLPGPKLHPHALLARQKVDNSASFYLTPVTETEVLRIISNLKNKPTQDARNNCQPLPHTSH